MREILKKLIGQSFKEMFDFDHDWIIINFGESTKYSLHVQCSLRVSLDGDLLLTSTDVICNPDKTEKEIVDKDGNLFDENQEIVNDKLTGAKVVDVEYGIFGDFTICFDNGVEVDICIDGLFEDFEYYRFIEYIPHYMDDFSCKSIHHVLECENGQIYESTDNGDDSTLSAKEMSSEWADNLLYTSRRLTSRKNETICLQALKKLIGQKFKGINVFKAEWVKIDFGEVPDYSLCVQCYIRIFQNGRLLFTSTDSFFNIDRTWKGDIDKPGNLLDENMKIVNDKLAGAKVLDIINGNCGDFTIYFDNGVIINVGVDCMVDKYEYYYLVESISNIICEYHSTIRHTLKYENGLICESVTIDGDNISSQA